MNLGNAWVEKCDKQGQHNHLTNIFSRNIEYQVLIFLYVDIVYVQHFWLPISNYIYVVAVHTLFEETSSKLFV